MGATGVNGNWRGVKPTTRTADPAGAAVASSVAVPGAAEPDRVCVGAVAGAHGLRGALRIKSFTEDPADIAAYGPVSDETRDHMFEIRVSAIRNGIVIAEFAGVDNRDAAEGLKGMRLYVERTALPPPDQDEYYHADLLGLAAVGTKGEIVGTVTAIIPAGESEVLEIDRGPGVQTLLLPFTAEAVHDVDVKGGRIAIEIPPGDEGDDKGLRKEMEG